LLGGLDPAQFQVDVEVLRPRQDYPFPWSFYRFLDAFPESVLGLGPELEPPSFDPEAAYDLVILAYTVWYLAPSLPVQAFLSSEHARVLRGRPVVTLCACRNMWHTASERMKRELEELGAHLMDNVVVSDNGPAWATFVSTPRWMFTGKSDRFLGVFPPAGVGREVIEGLERFGRALSDQRERIGERPVKPLLAGLGAVQVEPRFVVPELIGRFSFPPWARFVRLFGPPGSSLRTLPLTLFAVYLVLAILVLIPASILLRILLHPFVSGPLRIYVERLRSPSGGEAHEPELP
jgi:hypothetical protein